MLTCFRNGIQHGATDTAGAASNGDDNHLDSEKNYMLMCRWKPYAACKVPIFDYTRTDSVFQIDGTADITWGDWAPKIPCRVERFPNFG